jgi:hypothetical protein
MRANPPRPLAASLTLALAALAGSCVDALDPTTDSGAEADRDRKDAAGQVGCPSGTRTLSGQRVDPSRACIGESAALGCSTAAGCDDAETVVRDAEGSLWWLPNLCIPKGFEALPTAKEQEILNWKRCSTFSQPSDGGTSGYSDAAGYSDAGVCGARGREGCSRGECAVLGYPADEMRGCFGPCADATNGCSSVVTHASYADERVPSFQFPGGCIPSKFVSAPPPGGESVDDWPVCPEAAASDPDH